MIKGVGREKGELKRVIREWVKRGLVGLSKKSAYR